MNHIRNREGVTCFSKLKPELRLSRSLKPTHSRLLYLALLLISASFAAAQSNPIVVENAKPGNPPSQWDINGSGDSSIQGFATDISVNRGGTIRFKIKTDATSYRLDIYRLGYYNGLGARLVATVTPSVALPQSQPNPITNSATGLIDCGNWAESASWAVPADATSGVYIAKLVRTDNGGASHIAFVVRDDASTSDLFFQSSDTTWQAYNTIRWKQPLCRFSCRARLQGQLQPAVYHSCRRNVLRLVVQRGVSNDSLVGGKWLQCFLHDRSGH